MVVKNKLHELNTTESTNFKDVTFLYFLWFGISRCVRPLTREIHRESNSRMVVQAVLLCTIIVVCFP